MLSKLLVPILSQLFYSRHPAITDYLRGTTILGYPMLNQKFNLICMTLKFGKCGLGYDVRCGLAGTSACKAASSCDKECT